MRFGTASTSDIAAPAAVLGTSWLRASCLLLAVAFALCGVVRAELPAMPSADPSEAASPDLSPPARRAIPPRPAAGDWLDKRVALFKKALSLDSAQEVKLRQILADQRDAVRRVWADKKLLPAERAPATRAVEQRTGDRIRDILTEPQKLKYNPPKPPAPPTPASGAPSVEAWMQRARPKS